MTGAPPEHPPPEPSLCPHCGEPHDAYQEYCLECGLRLPSPYLVRRTVWSRESPVWLWGALLALLVVALVAGAIVAVAATRDEEAGAGRDSVPVVSTGPQTTDTIGVITDAGTITVNPPTTTLGGTTTFGGTTTVGGTTTFPTTTFGGTTTLQTTPSSTFLSWPAGRNGYTIVLKSTPTSRGRGPAENAGRQAQSNGLPQVGILNSSEYSSLRPGYYVTFTGIYDNESQAESNLSNARSRGFPLAYVRQVRD